eukprot:gene10757-12527_t
MLKNTLFRLVRTSCYASRVFAPAQLQTFRSFTTSTTTANAGHHLAQQSTVTQLPKDYTGDDQEEYDDMEGEEDYGDDRGSNSSNMTPKKKRKYRPHVNPLQYRYQVSTPLPDWPAIYGDSQRPLHVDLGCGNGESILRLSLTQPDYNYLGLDIRDHNIESAVRSKQTIEFEVGKPLDNLHVIQTNVNVNFYNIARSLPPSIIQKVSILFPDPWAKKSHLKRRMVNTNLVKEIALVTPVGAKMFQGIDYTKDEWDIPVSSRQRFYMGKDKHSCNTAQKAAIFDRFLSTPLHQLSYVSWTINLEHQVNFNLHANISAATHPQGFNILSNLQAEAGC